MPKPKTKRAKKKLPSKPTAPVIQVRGARQNNLKGLDLDIPLGKLNVITGPSGSGKSSLAFQTLYAEGQRRYVETFSPYTRQFFDRMDKPQVDAIHGIPPAIAIEQSNNVKTTRSTVGTITEINDYLKLFFPRVCRGYDPESGAEISPDTPQSILRKAREHFGKDTPLLVTFGIPVPEKTDTAEFFEFLHSQSYLRILVFGEIYRTDAPDKYDRPKLPALVDVIQDRVASGRAARFQEAVERGLDLGHNRINLVDANDPANRAAYSRGWASAVTDTELRAPTPALFSFNNPLGACPECRGFGRVIGIDLDRALPDRTMTIAEGVVRPFAGEKHAECQDDLERNSALRDIDIHTPFLDLPEAQQEWVLEGEYPGNAERAWEENEWYGVRGFFNWLESRAYKMHVRVMLSRYRNYTKCGKCRGSRLQPEALHFKIVTPDKARIADTKLPDLLTLPHLWKLPVDRLLPLVESLEADLAPGDDAADLLHGEILSRLRYLDRVGLSYLDLDRPTRTLSGGETERVNLTTCLGAALTNTLFVLDEPTVGLHPRDIHRLVEVMTDLRDRGNTLAVVEHEEAVIRAADHLIDIGPGRGEHGGHLTFEGPLPSEERSKEQGEGSRPVDENVKPASRRSTEHPSKVGWAASQSPEHPSHLRQGSGGQALNKDSLTLAYLDGTKTIPVPKTRRPVDKKRVLQIKAASANNLRSIDVTIPLGRFVCITGVSGSGKSTLIHDVLYRNLMAGRGQATGDSHSGSEPGPCRSITGDSENNIGDIVMVDQSPLSRTPRSTPAVYTGVFDDIRKLFADSPDGKARGVTPGYFSFNSGDGRCERCWGTGYEKVEMQFLSDLFVTCPECEGTRYTPEALEIELAEKNIHQMLRSTISESIEFFFALETGNKLPTRIVTSLQILADVGLGYLRLGQPLNTLSGGEAQRLKLVAHLLAQRKSRTNTANDLLIFDEPTTGLHFDDVAVLLKVFDRLVEAGNSLLIIEHNLEVIKSADHLIDLGPEAGRHGGQVVAEGTPEEVAKVKTSHTGQYLKTVLGTKAAKKKATTSLKIAESPTRYKTKSRTGRSLLAPCSQLLTPKTTNAIEVRGAREHNLKNIDLQIPRDQFVVVTGLSGSGKSTLAFDILFAEGQRRFLDSMSAYARQFVEQLERPDIDLVSGLPPTVAIEQRISRGGGKSTVATVTEVWHFVRLLYAKTGTQHSPDTGKALVRQSLTAIVTRLRNEAKKRTGKGKNNQAVTLMAPLIKARKGYHNEVAAWAERQGFDTLFVDRQFKPVKGFQRLERFKEHSIDVVVLKITKATKPAEIRTAVEFALKIGKRSARYLDAKNHAHHLSTELSDPDTGRSFEELDPRLFSYNSPHGWCAGCRGYGRIETKPASDDPNAESQLDAELREERRRSRTRSRVETIPCPVCNGARLNEIALAVRVANQPIDAIAGLSVSDAYQHFEKLKFTGTHAAIARDILPEIRQRLQFMAEVGLGYLQLDRSATTLSGGESQRIRLAAQLGSNLRGVLYILDEPTIGLHPRDNAALLDTLEELCKKGNSLLVVEHDEDTVRRADHVIDLGPGAGLFGGEVVLSAPLKNKKLTKKFRAEHPDSPTLEAMAEPMPHPLRGERRPLPAEKSRNGWLKIKGAHANNLKNLDVKLPLGRLTVITGISGSGKSSFMRGVLEPAIDELFAIRKKKRDKTLGNLAKLPDHIKAKALSGAADIAAMYDVDQSPIGKTSRSTPATYVKVFDEIRKLFAQLPEARARGYTASLFSFNTEGGRCEACKGNGRIKLEMNFLPTSNIECEDCRGQRYNPPTLEIEYKGKNIGQIMDLTIDEAADFFSAYSKIHRTLSLMRDTGLGYLKLGQPSPTVSGGEAQRIKLVTELTRGIGRSENARVRKNLSLKSAGTNLYLIEEPSIGLHMQDVRKLHEVLHRLVDDGHTVVVIEHNLDIIAEADYLIDIGPEAGPAGGEIVAEGTPEVVARNKASRTAPFLKSLVKAVDQWTIPKESE